jgi:hypothetical protein
MRLIINADNRIAAGATDDYEGPNPWVQAPEDFDQARMAEYLLVDGALVLVPTSKITKLSFRNRFTESEKIMIEMAALDNPTAPMPERLQSAKLRVYLADVNAARDYIDLQRLDTRAGVVALEGVGLLQPGRALEILDAPIQPHERPE